MKKDTLLEKIKDLSDLDKHQEIIDMIEGLPTEQLNNEIIGQLGRAYNNVQNYEKAIEVLKSIEKDEKNTMLWNYRMGCSYFYLKDYEKAEEYFLKAYNLEPEDENIKDFLMDIYINLSKQVKFGEDDLDNQKKALNYALKAKDYMTTDDKKIECYSYLAFLYNKFTDYHTAEDLLKRAISLGRDDLWIHSELGYCLGELNKLEESLEHYLRAIEIAPSNTWLLSQIAWTYRCLGRYEEALKENFKALDLGENSEWVYVEIGYCYKELNNYDKALKYYLEANKISKDKNVWLLSELVWLYNGIKKYENALEYLKKLEKLGRDDSWFNSEYGFCLIGLKKYNEAIEKYKHALEKENNLKEIIRYNSQIGFCYRLLEKYEEAIENLKKALEILNEDKTNDNTDEKIFLNSQIGWIYGKIENSNPEEALYYLYAAKKLGRDDEWINAEIGWELGYKAVGKDEEAVKYFERAIKLGRNDEWIWIRIADIYFDLKRYEDALKAYNKAYEFECLHNEGQASLYIRKIGKTLRRLGRYEEAIEKLLESRKLSLEEGEKVEVEDLELSYCYATLGDRDNGEKYMKLFIDSVGVRIENDEKLKKELEELKEMVNMLYHPS